MGQLARVCPHPCVLARRQILSLEFVKITPLMAQVSWEVAPWGSWRVFARSAGYEALVEATCAAPGTPLRAPTATDGLAPFCRDSFHGQARAHDTMPNTECYRAISARIDIEVHASAHASDGRVPYCRTMLPRPGAHPIPAALFHVHPEMYLTRLW